MALFIHEIERVFMDRCIKKEHITKLKKYLSNAMHDIFEKDELDCIKKDFLIFTPFIYEREHGEFMILPVTSWKELKGNLELSLEEYNETNIVMNLVLFKDAMLHVCRIVRILF